MTSEVWTTMKKQGKQHNIKGRMTSASAPYLV